MPDNPDLCGRETLFGIRIGDIRYAKDGTVCADCAVEEEGKLTREEMFYYVGIPVIVFFAAIGVLAYFFRDKWLHKVTQRLVTSRGGSRVRDPNGSILSKVLMLVNFFQVENMFMNPATFETDPEEFSISFEWLGWANFDLEKGLACWVKGDYGIVFLTFVSLPIIVGLLFGVLLGLTLSCAGGRKKNK